MTHLLVTNDFPPKVGGIQSYLWELWRRLPPERVTVLTTPSAGSAPFDAAQAFRVERTRQRVLLPTPGLVRRIDSLARQVGARVVVLDPALPLAMLGRRSSVPYAVVVHGAEITVPGRVPGARSMLASVVRGASHVIAAGGYPAAEARRAGGVSTPAITVVPPGVDTGRFRPLDDGGRRAARRRLGLPEDALLIVAVSRLVPRKGMDVLLEAASRLRARYPSLVVAVAGAGRDRARLEKIARPLGGHVRFLGRVPDPDLPALYACGDVFAMLCRNRWAGLEQEGFGIVFLEAAACGVPQLAGDSGGAAEAVAHEETGLVVRRPADVAAVTAALDRLLGDGDLRARMGAAARERAVRDYDYDVLAARLDVALSELERAG